MKTIPLIALLAAPLLFTNCEETKQRVNAAKVEAAVTGDITFARSTFESLAQGNTSVSQQIDWPVFTSLGDNVGSSYVALTTPVDKEKFITGFITQFATAFRESGGSIANFTNWRVLSHDALKTEVVADSANGLLTVTVSVRDGVERVSSINIK